MKEIADGAREGREIQPSAKLTDWDIERAEFWERTGKAIAVRNLVVSIPCLLFAFAIWLYWSIIIVQMKNLGFQFSTTELYTLPAIAGLVGATLRIPNSFMIAISGGRNVIAVTTALLIHVTGRGRRDRASESADELYDVCRSGRVERNRWWSVRFVDVQYQLLLPKADAGAFPWSQRRIG